MSTTNVMSVAPQTAAQTKVQSSKPVAKAGKKTAASDDSFDEALGKASTDVKQSAADAAADAQDGAGDAGARDDKQQDPLAAVLAASQQAKGSSEEPAENTPTQDGTEPAVVLTISDAVKGQFVNTVQTQTTAQSNLQSLIPQSAEAGLKNQDFLAMLSGQQLKSVGQETLTQGQAQSILQSAVQTGNASVQMAGQQAGAGTILEAQLATSQQGMMAQPGQVQNATTANQQPVIQTAQAAFAAEAVAPTIVTTQASAAQTAVQPVAGQAKDSDTKTASGLLNGATLSVEDRTQAVPLRMDAQQAMDQQHTSSGQQDAAGQNQSQPDTGDAGSLMQQLPEEAAADRAASSSVQEKTDHTANNQVSMFQQGLQDSIKGTGTVDQVQAGQQTQTDYDIPRQIVDQARLIRTNENTEMVIKLNPDHLGELTLKVSVSQNGSVNASFHSDNAQVRTIIENSLVQLRQELNNQGIKVDSVEVYAGLADGQLPQDQGQQAWQNNQQGSSNTAVRGVQMGTDDYVEEAESLSAAVHTRENTAMEGVDYRI